MTQLSPPPGTPTLAPGQPLTPAYTEAVAAIASAMFIIDVE